MKTLILFLMAASFNLQAQSLSDRLSEQLNLVEQNMSSAETLLQEDGRDAAFKLQAYGRLFENDFKKLTTLKDHFKELEDQLGQCKRWSDLIRKSQVPESKKKIYQQNLVVEMEKLSSLLDAWSKKDKMGDFKSLISRIKLNDEETLELADKNITKESKELIKKKFDFKYGETGLHELRRSIRWPKIYFELFSNQIVLKKTKCTVSKNDLYNIGLAKNKMTFTGSADSEAIVLNECAFIKLVGAVELLGNVKDELEKEEILEDKLPKEIKEQTQSIYKELVEEILPQF